MIRGLPWIIGGALIAAAIVLFGLGSLQASTALFAAGGLIVVSGIGHRMAVPADRRWLPTAIAFAYLLKLAASATRWGVLEFVYNGKGDASGYHGAGTELSAVWKAFGVPEIGIGTKFVDAATGLLYVPYVPTFLGGFFFFATLAFFGQMLMYAAFRKGADPSRLRWYAAAIFLLPTIVYWPSSIGKESLMFLFIGIAVYGAASLLRDYRLRWAALFSVGVAGSAIIRPHVAILLVLALAFALIFAKGRPGGRLTARRVVALGVISVVLVASAAVVTAKFAVDFASGLDATEDVGNVLNNVGAATSKGGSGTTGSAITNPLDFPAGFVKVLFRPFPQEATNVLALISSIEGMLLLGLFVWRIIPLAKNGWHIRRDPYLVFSLVFTIGFVSAFSAFNNFGLLARQRSQVMPFFMALLIALGWSTVTGKNESDDDATSTEPQRAST